MMGKCVVKNMPKIMFKICLYAKLFDRLFNKNVVMGLQNFQTCITNMY